MDCNTCNELLAACKDAVLRFPSAVATIPGSGSDSKLATEQAGRLRLECQNANEALMEHWREEHRGLAAKAEPS